MSKKNSPGGRKQAPPPKKRVLEISHAERYANHVYFEGGTDVALTFGIESSDLIKEFMTIRIPLAVADSLRTILNQAFEPKK